MYKQNFGQTWNTDLLVCSVSPTVCCRSAVPGGPSGPVPGPAGHHMLPGEGGLAEALTHQEDAAQQVGGLLLLLGSSWREKTLALIWVVW